MVRGAVAGSSRSSAAAVRYQSISCRHNSSLTMSLHSLSIRSATSHHHPVTPPPAQLRGFAGQNSNLFFRTICVFSFDVVAIMIHDFLELLNSWRHDTSVQAEGGIIIKYRPSPHFNVAVGANHCDSIYIYNCDGSPASDITQPCSQQQSRGNTSTDFVSRNHNIANRVS